MKALNEALSNADTRRLRRIGCRKILFERNTVTRRQITQMVLKMSSGRSPTPTGWKSFREREPKIISSEFEESGGQLLSSSEWLMKKWAETSQE